MAKQKFTPREGGTHKVPAPAPNPKPEKSK